MRYQMIDEEAGLLPTTRGLLGGPRGRSPQAHRLPEKHHPEQRAHQQANSGHAQLGAGVAGFPGQSGHLPSDHSVIVLHPQAVRWGGVADPGSFGASWPDLPTLCAEHFLGDGDLLRPGGVVGSACIGPAAE